MFFPNRRTALAYLTLLVPPLLITVLAFGMLATLDESAIAVGTPLNATATPIVDPLVQLQAGITQQKAGNYAAALSFYQAALAIDSQLAPVHGALGSLYVAMERPQSAIASYREAVWLEPDRAEWQHSLGVVLANQGQVTEGLAELEAAAILAPDDAMLHYELGEVYAYLARHDEARQAFQRVLALAPDSQLAGAAVAQLDRLAGEP